jgi:hypothetical protein
VKSLIFFLISMMFLTLVSCSSGSTPTNSLDLNEPQSDISHFLPYAPIISHSVDGTTTYQGAFGVWKISIDTRTLTAEIIPARNAMAIGNIFDADLSQFLTVSPCENCLMIGRVNLDDYGMLNVQFGMKHPFSNIAARPDLHGFDVRGILIVPSDLGTTYPTITLTRPDGTEEAAQPSTGVILNADGYTSHFDEICTDTRYFMYTTDVPGNLNPFLRFFEDYNMPAFDPLNPSGQNVMKVGASLYTRTAVFSKEASELDNLVLYFVADVAYGQSAVLANRANPQYYLPAFHRTEPYRVEYWMENNNLSFFDPVSTSDVVVQVFDWQQDATVDPGYPNPGNLSGIPESSKVLSLELSIPGMQNATLIQNTPESGTGTSQDPLQYRFTVTNELTYHYNVTGFLAIRDELNGQASPHGRSPIPVSPAGFPYETPDIRDYSMYEVIYINIPNGMSPYPDEVVYSENNELFITGLDLLAWNSIDPPTTVLHPTFFMDPGHKKFQYKWELDGDGLFDDATGLPSPVLSYPTGGKKDIQLRVRTNSKPPREYIYDLDSYFAEVVGYNTELRPAGTNEDTSSRRASHAICQVDGVFYVAYLHESGGQRDVWLSIWDNSGLIANVPVTNDSTVEFEPVIYVKKYANEGVYIAYKVKDGATDYLYATHGNLDGSGFESSNVKEVDTSSGTISNLCLIQYDNKLYLYYTVTSIVSKIKCAHSTSWGSSWIADGNMVNNSSFSQRDLAAGVWGWGPGDGVVLVWSDGINSPETGHDLWFAEADDGLTFDTFKNISSFTDATEEGQPSISPYEYDVRIVYISSEVGDPAPNVRLKCYGITNNQMVDRQVSFGEGSNVNFISPSIASIEYDHVLVAYAAYNTSTHELTAYALDLVHPNAVTGLGATYLWQETLGTVNPGEAAIYSCVATSDSTYYAAENFVFYRDCSDGFALSPNSPSEYFCTVKGLYFVTPVGDYY